MYESESNVFNEIENSTLNSALYVRLLLLDIQLELLPIKKVLVESVT